MKRGDAYPCRVFSKIIFCKKNISFAVLEDYFDPHRICLVHKYTAIMFHIQYTPGTTLMSSGLFY